MQGGWDGTEKLTSKENLLKLIADELIYGKREVFTTDQKV